LEKSDSANNLLLHTCSVESHGSLEHLCWSYTINRSDNENYWQRNSLFPGSHPLNKWNIKVPGRLRMRLTASFKLTDFQRPISLSPPRYGRSFSHEWFWEWGT